jgi:drug/metabolite transporter (DMT)-like permease
MELYIIFALASAIFFSVAMIINKHILKNVTRDYLLLVFYFSVLGPLAALMIWLAVPFKFPPPDVIPYMVGNTVFYFIAMIVANYTFVRGDVSMLGPLFQTKTLFLVFLAFFLLGESFAPGTYLWILLLVFGGVVVSLDERFDIRLFFTKFILVVFFSNFLWSMTDIMAKNVLNAMDVWNANAWRMLLMGVMSLTLVPFLKKGKMWLGTKNLLYIISILILADIAGVGLILMAFELGTVTLSNAFAMMRGPFIIVMIYLISVFKPNLIEEHSKKVYLARLVGSVIMIFAAIQLMV